MTADRTFILNIIDKQTAKFGRGCPSSQIPLRLGAVVREMIADGTLKIDGRFLTREAS